MFQSGILRTRLIGVSAFALVVIGGCEDGVGQGNDAAVLDGGPTDGPMVELDGSVPDEDAGRREGDGGESDAGVCECTCTHYVSPDGTAGGDGSEGSPWSLAHAAAMASPGDTVCVAAGDYGDTSLRLDTSGEPDRPIRFVGYRATPFDIELPTDHSTFVRGDAPDAATMPLLDGGDGTGDAIVINGDHIGLESLQIRRYDMGVRIHGDFVTLDNVIVSEQGNLSSASSYSGFGIFVFGDDVTLRRCFVEDAGAEGIKASGALRPVIRFTEVFAENASNPMDYYLLLTGDTRDALVEDSIVYRTPGLEHGGHGFTIKDQGTGNVFRRCHAFHTSLELNFGGVTGNTFEDCTLQGRDTSPGAWPAAIAVNNGAHDNLFRNIRVRDVWTAISFRDYDDGYTGPGGDRDLEATGIDNRFVNLVIEHANRIVGVTAGDPSFAAETRGNHFYNCTFHDFERLAVVYFDGTDFRFVNTILDGITNGSYIAGPASFGRVFDHVSFSNSAGSPPSGTAVTTQDPRFVDPDAGDFRLRADSPLIDQGVDTPYAYDFEGTERPAGAFDIGSYER